MFVICEMDKMLSLFFLGWFGYLSWILWRFLTNRNLRYSNHLFLPVLFQLTLTKWEGVKMAGHWLYLSKYINLTFNQTKIIHIEPLFQGRKIKNRITRVSTRVPLVKGERNVRDALTPTSWDNMQIKVLLLAHAPILI